MLQEGKDALRAVRDMGFRSDLLVGEGLDAYEFVLEYNTEYGSLPDPMLVTGKTGIDLDPVPPGSSTVFFAKELINRNLHLHLTRGLKDPTSSLADENPQKALAELQDLVFNASKLQLGGDSKLVQMFSLGNEVWDHYLQMESGKRGILTPWESINESTLGFGPEELILFAARTGTGKTWVLLLLAECAWKQGKKVLFITTEMSKLRIALRFFAIHLKYEYGLVLKGKLPVFQREALKSYLDTSLEKQGIYVVGGNFDFRIESVAAAIDEAKPDIVLIDGIYLIQSSGKDRMEKAANVFSDVKRLTITKKVPIVVSSQFNREVKANQAATARTESIALTDAAAWHSTLVFGAVQTDDNKKENRMQMKQMKVRDGAGEDFELEWNFRTMAFGEIPKADSGGASFSSDMGGFSSGGGDGSGLPF